MLKHCSRCTIVSSTGTASGTNIGPGSTLLLSNITCTTSSTTSSMERSSPHPSRSASSPTPVTPKDTLQGIRQEEERAEWTTRTCSLKDGRVRTSPRTISNSSSLTNSLRCRPECTSITSITTSSSTSTSS
eukprot:Hpha_TRINITY_DN15761_c6_g1::TRINITY_DN15761_c6_g1_i3::g.38620::m.38620